MGNRKIPIVEEKYNEWCHRTPLVKNKSDDYFEIVSKSKNNTDSQSEADANYFHNLTQINGLEFIAISNAKFDDYITLAKDIMLVPCFYTKLEGTNMKDPIAQLTLLMQKKSRFIYDGWIPINPWEKKNVQDAILKIEEVFSYFSLNGDIYFKWEPKYLLIDSQKSNYIIEKKHISEFKIITKKIDLLSTEDRTAIYRSIGWISQGIRLKEPAAKLLFSILAIESLITYIEREAEDNSIFISLQTEKLSKSERRKNREECIKTIISEKLDTKPTKAIEDAYFDCIHGIKKLLINHLENNFSCIIP